MADPNPHPPEIDIPEQQVPDVPDVLEVLETTLVPNYGWDLEDFQWADKVNALQLKVHNLTAERTMLSQRKIYALAIFVLSAVWLTFIMFFLWKAGKRLLTVSDPVLIALITTTTINVLGLFYIVARWLFPHKPPESKTTTTRE